MERFLKQTSVNQVLLALFLISLFFPLRYVFLSSSAYLTGSYSDFTSFSLYSCDILLILLAVFNIKRLFNRKILLVLLGLVVVLGLEVLLRNQFSSLLAYFSVKVLEFALVYLLFQRVLRDEFRKLIPLLVLLGAIQGFIAIFQFYSQESIGLYRLGESHIGAMLGDVAKVVARGTLYIRSYGTFPHPNVMAGVLGITTILNIYLLNKTSQKIPKLAYSITLFVQNLGLVLSLSRIGFMGFIAAAAVLFGFLFVKQGNIRRTTWIFAVLVLSLGVSLSLVLPIVRSRSTFTDPATTERWYFNHISMNMLKDKPIFGVGPGTSVLHMEQYSPASLQSWQKQPTHNYYLLVLTEFGLIIGTIALGYILYQILRLIKIVVRGPIDTYGITLIAIAAGFLVIMGFDHYFYTIEQSQLLFWMIIGLIAGENVRNNTLEQHPD